MSPLDATFLYVEDGTTHMHIASCALFEGPPPSYDAVVESIASKLGQVPRCRQVVRFVPMQLGRPVWTDDVHFRIEHHVHHTGLPRPGGKAELCELMGRLMSQELDRRRPLWEAWVVEGLLDDQWALITKIHHCMADGVSGADLHGAILDAERHPPRLAVDAWEPAPEPSRLRLVAEAGFHLASRPYEQLRMAGRLIGAPRRATTQLREFAGGMLSYARHVRPTEANSLVGTIGPHRRWTWVSTELDDAMRIRQALGGTVNDVIVSVVTGGFRDLLLARNEPVAQLVVRSLVPVSVRDEDERGICDNRVSAMLADLPVSIADPIERLAAVQDQLATLKRSHQAAAGERLTAFAGVLPTAVIALAERGATEVMRWLPQRSVNTVTTNVPGPSAALYLAGRQMVEFMPFVPIASGVRVGVAIVSYHGRLSFGVTGDEDTAPDIDILADGIGEGMSELLKLATAIT